MKNLVGAALAAGIVIFPLIAFSQSDSVKAPLVAKVGVIAPLTGEGAPWGENTRDGINLALDDENNAAGRRYKVLPLFEDDKCDPKLAVSAFQRLTTIDHVKYIVGPVCSSSTLAVAPLAERSKTVIITPCSEADEISSAGEYIFRTWAPGGRQAKLVAEYIRNRLGLTKAAILAIENDFGVTLSRRFKESFEALGGKIVAQESYKPSPTDLRTEILRVKAAGPEAIYLGSYMQDIVLAVQQVKTLKLNTPIFGSSNFATRDILKSLGPLAEGIIFADLNDSTSEPFRKRFTETFHKPWPGLTSCGPTAYDAFRMLAAAVQVVGDDPEAVQKYLAHLENFSGVTGSLTFDQNGDLTVQHQLFRVENGTPKLLLPP